MKKVICFKLDDDIYTSLKTIAEESRMSLSELLRIIIMNADFSKLNVLKNYWI